MKSSALKATLIAAALAMSLAAGGCAGDTADDSAMQAEIDALRSDLDQLANAVGRLEFRIYELENFHPAGNGAIDTTEVDDGSAARADTKNGLIDLTPVD